MSEINGTPHLGFVCWLAGFFDGEGSISASKGCMTKLQLAQSGDIGRKVLSSVKDTMGVGYLVVDCKNHRLPAWRWVVYRKEDVKWVLNLLIPHLMVKKIRAQEVLEYLNDTKGRLGRREANFIKFNCASLSMGEMAKALNRNAGTIRHFLKKHRLPQYRRKAPDALLYTAKTWDREEDTILTREYLAKTSGELGALLNRSPHSIRARARILGIATKSKAWRWHR